MTVAAVRTQVRHGDEADLGDVLFLWCPGCELLHTPCVRVGDEPRPLWQWDGSLDAPTVSPSILVTTGEARCHSFVRAGSWQFLSDCTHALAGQTVPLPDLPGWAVEEAA